MNATMTLIILAAAIVTYGTRVAGYIIIQSMSRIPQRMEAALNAVPTAVLSSIVAPAFVYGGLDVTVTMILAGLVGLRASSFTMLGVGWVFIVALRQVTG